MAKYLFLKHYRGAPAAVNDVPMDQWTPEEIEAHMQYMEDFADRLRDSGEFVDSQALRAEGAWVKLPRYTASAAYLHERAGDIAVAAKLYAQAASEAQTLPERNHLTLRAATLRHPQA